MRRIGLSPLSRGRRLRTASIQALNLGHTPVLVPDEGFSCQGPVSPPPTRDDKRFTVAVTRATDPLTRL